MIAGLNIRLPDTKRKMKFWGAQGSLGNAELFITVTFQVISITFGPLEFTVMFFRQWRQCKMMVN